MRILRSISEVREALRPAKLAARRVGLVPTMGALHEGHLSLVSASRQACDVTVVSVFVNPTQFGEGEDFEAYPRDLEADAAMLEAAGVDFLFAPTVEEMYPSGAVTKVDPGSLGAIWCGASRPGHFVGVATVVTKLLGIVGPDAAFFGEKDYQQLQVLKRVVADLDLPVEVVGCPIVREADGLALSSRNRYLTSDQRSHALVLSRALTRAAERVAGGDRDAVSIAEELSSTIASEPEVILDYATVVDAHTLQPLAEITAEARALVAARVGKARLIDNVALRPSASS